MEVASQESRESKGLNNGYGGVCTLENIFGIPREEGGQARQHVRDLSVKGKKRGKLEQYQPFL